MGNEIRAQREKQGDVKSLPWELDNEAQSIVAEDLMEKVLSLGLDDANFREEPKPPTHFDFEMERHVEVITRLLEIDPNLSKVHYRLSAKMDERIFWRNYFHRCALLRADVGVGEPLRRITENELNPAGSRPVGIGRGDGGNDECSQGGGSSLGPYPDSKPSVVDSSDMDALDAEVNAELGDEEFDEDGLNLADEIDGEEGPTNWMKR